MKKIAIILLAVVSQQIYGQSRKINLKLTSGQNITQEVNKAQSSVAGQKDVTLVFPAGTYLIDQVNITCNWEGTNGTVLQITDDDKNSAYNTLGVSKNTSPILVKGLQFRGIIKNNPSSYSLIAIKNIKGKIPFFLSSAVGVTIRDCGFANSFMSNLRIQKCSDIHVENCTFTNARGVFGDGVYIAQSSQIFFDNCTATDYTRMGFVAEAFSSDISFSRCRAKNGHDGSKLYGGGEFNGGFWVERSYNVVLKNCVSQDNEHAGFVYSAGGTDLAATHCSYINCTSINNKKFGFEIKSSNKNSVVATVDSCKVSNSAISYILLLTNNNDNVDINKSDSYISSDGRVASSTGFLINGFKGNVGRYPTVTMTDCRSVFKAGESRPLLRQLASARLTPSADISSSQAGNVNLNVSNFITSDKSVKPVIKLRNNLGRLNIR